MSESVRTCCLVLTLSVCALPGETQAGEPHAIERTFAVLTFDPVDFTDEESVLVGATKSDATPAILEFLDPHNPNFDGTLWVTGATMHITKGEGLTPMGVLWLLSEETPEPPPIGAVAITGHEASLVQGSLGNVKIVSGGYIVPTTDQTAKTMIVATAVFNK